MAKHPRHIAITGKVLANGIFSIYGKDAMSDYFKNWPNTSFVGYIKVYQPGTSQALRGYYFGKVVPDFKNALQDQGSYLTQEETEAYIRALCPIMVSESVNEQTGVYTSKLRTLSELDTSELYLYIDHLKEIAAQDYHFFIDDPRTI